MTYLRAARFHLAGKNPPRPLCNDSLQCPQLAVDRASPTRRVIWSTLSFHQRTCGRISSIFSHFIPAPGREYLISPLFLFPHPRTVSRTRQLQGSGSAGHPVGSPCKGLLAPASRQPLPALPPPCRQAGKQVPASRSPHCQQACPTQQRGGQSGSSEQFPLCQQVTSAGRLAGGRASTSRLLPHDPFRQASSTRLPFQDFSRAARLRYD